jgi:hypothetical protein
VWYLAFVVILGGLIIQTTANADTFTFGDNAYFWGDTPAHDATPSNSWANGQGSITYSDGTTVHDDAQDEIGTPVIPATNYSMGGGSIEVATVGGNTYLQQVNINYVNSDVDFSNMLQVGDLFLDDHNQNGGNTWDWVAEGQETDGTVGVHDYSTSGGIALGTQASNDPSNPTYVLSGKDNSDQWAGYDVRDDHPYALTSYNTASSSAAFSGWTVADGSGTLTWNFAQDGSSGLLLSTTSDGMFDLGLGFTVSCANDVLFESVSSSTTQGTPIPTPEPATLLLFVSGLAGIGVKRSRRAA